MNYLPEVKLGGRDEHLYLFERTGGIFFDRTKCPICFKRPLGHSKSGEHWACKKCLKNKSAAWLLKFLLENQGLLFPYE